MAYFKLSKDVLLEHYNNLVSNDWKVTYSVKTNPIVGRVLDKNTDCEHSIQSLDEMQYLSDASRVWYLCQALNQELLSRIFDKGIKKFVIENSDDLTELLAYLEPHSDMKVDVMLRMRIKENTIFTGRYYVFGMSSTEVNTHVEKLASHEQIRSIGLHFHRKTQNVSEWDIINELRDSVVEENWTRIDCVNIGGGFPARYRNISDAAIESVFRKVNAVKDWLKSKNVSLMVEPGRYLAAPCIQLHTTITGIRGRTLIVDASVYQCAMDTLLVPIKLLVEGEILEGDKWLIKGKTPCSMDIFRYDVRFANDPKVGDEIIFLNAGAYNFCTEFCELTTLETREI